MERKKSVRRHRRYEKPFAKRCKDFFRQFVAFMFSNVGIIGLVVGYTMMGAIIFMAIEGKQNIQAKTDVNRTRNSVAIYIWNLAQTLNVFCEDKFKSEVNEKILDYQKFVIQSIKKGYNGDDFEDTSTTPWTFSGAYLYSLTVITTIGYGNICPRTPEGKITTIVYAIIGMPLFLLYLSNIGDIMARSFKWIYANCCLCRWCPEVAKRRAERRRRRALQLQHMSLGGDADEWQVEVGEGGFYPSFSEQGQDDDATEMSMESYDPQTVTVPVTICLAIMIGYICGGAILFSKWEDWEFLEGSYFCFISLSTIGFGDIVPGNETYSGQVGFIFCSMYLMLGMALIAMCFNLMQEEVIHKIRTTIRTVKYMLRCNR